MGKGGRCVGLTNLTPSCAVVMNSGNLNFLKPSEPLQACNGIPLPFTIYRIFHNIIFLVHKIFTLVVLGQLWGVWTPIPRAQN